MLLWPRLYILLDLPILRPLYPVMLAVMLGLSGCSAKNRIDGQAISIQQAATASTDRFKRISDLSSSSLARFESVGDADGTAEQQAIQAEAAAGQAEQAGIAGSASTIRTDLHGVEDIVPWWAGLLGQLALAATVVAVLILLWKSGALDFIRRIFWGMGMMLPKKAKAEARMDLRALADDDAMTLSECVAAKRARDPAYCAAFKKESKRTR
jgi:hypothetical protein